MLWYGILAALFAVEIVMIALLRWRRKDRPGRTGKPWLCPVIALAVCAALAVWSPANALIALLHLCVFLCVGILVDASGRAHPTCGSRLRLHASCGLGSAGTRLTIYGARTTRLRQISP